MKKIFFAMIFFNAKGNCTWKSVRKKLYSKEIMNDQSRIWIGNIESDLIAKAIG